jgi:hypothetical protein
MDAAEFIEKWRSTPLPERAAAQQHFLELCELLGVEKPPTTGPETADYRFEAPVIGADDRPGFADAFRRGCFGWEYKKRRASLVEARSQLLRYAGSLGNPSLLVTCDHDRIEVTTNFNGYPSQREEFRLENLIAPAVRARLAQLWTNPEAFRPARTTAQLTEDAAERFSVLIDRLQGRGHPAPEVAHFVNQLLFCLFAERAGLFPDGLFGRLLRSARAGTPEDATAAMDGLLDAMRRGGIFGADRLDRFNGRLFDGSSALPFRREDLALLADLAMLDWSAVEPAIFGTLFERRLSPNWGGTTGTHYTPRDKIESIIEAVVSGPLRAEWARVRTEIEALLVAPVGEPALTPRPARRVRGRRTAAGLFGDTLAEATAVGQRVSRRAARDPAMVRREGAHGLFLRFLERLRAVRVLDPAAGSGNFLYVTLVALKDLELEVITDGERLGFPPQFPGVGPEAVLGIELDEYAVELARVAVWIGELQWMLRKGFGYGRDPVLRPLETICRGDAVMVRDDAGRPVEPEWPAAEAIVGNPPFLGRGNQRSQLGNDYVEALRRLYAGRVPADADLACYWFEKARAQVAAGRTRRVGLVVTSKIAYGANRTVLDRIDGRGAAAA